MGLLSAYQCDGPTCQALTNRAKGTRYPDDWPRITVTQPDGTAATGCFHSPNCAAEWVEAKLPKVTKAIIAGDKGLGGQTTNTGVSASGSVGDPGGKGGK